MCDVTNFTKVHSRSIRNSCQSVMIFVPGLCPFSGLLWNQVSRNCKQKKPWKNTTHFQHHHFYLSPIIRHIFSLGPVKASPATRELNKVLNSKQRNPGDELKEQRIHTITQFRKTIVFVFPSHETMKQWMVLVKHWFYLSRPFLNFPFSQIIPSS